MSSRYSLATLGRVSLRLRFAPASSTDAIRQTPCAFASFPVSIAPKPDSLQKEASGFVASLLATPSRVAPVSSRAIRQIPCAFASVPVSAASNDLILFRP